MTVCITKNEGQAFSLAGAIERLVMDTDERYKKKLFPETV